eukprot:jgi/Chlat1/3188/Chrsp22S03410
MAAAATAIPIASPATASAADAILLPDAIAAFDSVVDRNCRGGAYFNPPLTAIPLDMSSPPRPEDPSPSSYLSTYGATSTGATSTSSGRAVTAADPPAGPAQQQDSPTRPGARRRNAPGNPDPTAEVIALTPEELLASNRFYCEVCGKGFQRDQNLQLHRRGHNLPWQLTPRSTAEPRKRVYICPEPTCVHHQANRALGDLTGIKKHYSRKHGEKKYECEKCHKKYAVPSDWKAHVKSCGAREWLCTCGTQFTRKDSLIMHCKSYHHQPASDTTPGRPSKRPLELEEGPSEAGPSGTSDEPQRAAALREFNMLGGRMFRVGEQVLGAGATRRSDGTTDFLSNLQQAGATQLLSSPGQASLNLLLSPYAGTQGGSSSLHADPTWAALQQLQRTATSPFESPRVFVGTPLATALRTGVEEEHLSHFVDRARLTTGDAALASASEMPSTELSITNRLQQGTGLSSPQGRSAMAAYQASLDRAQRQGGLTPFGALDTRTGGPLLTPGQPASMQPFSFLNT